MTDKVNFEILHKETSYEAHFVFQEFIGREVGETTQRQNQLNISATTLGTVREGLNHGRLEWQELSGLVF